VVLNLFCTSAFMPPFFSYLNAMIRSSSAYSTKKKSIMIRVVNRSGD